MRGEIVAVGTELLLGQIVNTNAAYLARALAELGVEVYRQTVVGDNRQRLVAALRDALTRAELVVTCGGLGPTPDDLTREAVAEALGLPLLEDGEARRAIEEFCRRHGLPLDYGAERQAMVPAGSVVLPNEVGSAPGFIARDGDRVVVSLPGPPAELRPMLERAVAYLAALPGGRAQVILSRVLRLAGIGEAAAALAAGELLEGANPTVAPYARPGEVQFRITARAPSRGEAAALIARVEEELRRRLGEYVFGADDESMEVVVGNLLRRRGLALALAESCTGGLVSRKVTSVPGSSDYYVHGVVSYANEAKVRILGVPRETLERWGAVSWQTAVAMARGALALGADVAASTTGIAGPGGGTAAKPVGTVYFGLATPTAAWWRHRVFAGDRATVQEWAAQEALAMVWDFLRGREPGQLAPPG